jgi:hypothetical protein
MGWFIAISRQLWSRHRHPERSRPAMLLPSKVDRGRTWCAKSLPMLTGPCGTESLSPWREIIQTRNGHVPQQDENNDEENIEERCRQKGS